MQLLGILIVMAGIFAGITFSQELIEYETHRRRVQRQQALFRRTHPASRPHRQLRMMSTNLFDQDAM